MFDARTATSVQMAQIAAEGDAMEYNRQIAEWVIGDLDPTHPIKVCPVMLHEHAGGEKVETHLRTTVSFKLKNGTDGSAFVDMQIETFKQLPLFDEEVERAAESARAREVAEVGAVVEMELLFDGQLCGNPIKLPKFCKVEFLKTGFSPFRIIEGILNESLSTWEDGQNRYILPAESDEDDDENDEAAIARFEYIAE